MRINAVKSWFAIALFGLGGTSFLSGQQFHTDEVDPTVQVYPAVESPLLKTVQFSECEDEWDFFLKTTKRYSIPGQEASLNETSQWKAAANAARPEPGSELPGPAMKKSAVNASPVLGSSFVGNSYNNFDPADNGIAISHEGAIVSVANSTIHVFDSSGSNQFSTSLLGFSGPLTGVPAFRFDPRVTYDPVAERFIVVYLAGASPGSSEIVLAFSQSSDPTAGWNFYKLTGDPFSTNLWTDYPAIGISNDELFITCNLFNGQFQYQNSCLWVVEKADGYAGTALTSTPISTSYYSMTPVQGGLNLYGPNFYFVRTANLPASNAVSLHEMTNTQANGGTLLSPTTFTMNTPYSSPPDAPQLGTNIQLATNFNTVLSAYYENNKIQFALTSAVGGKSGIIFGTGRIQPPFSTFLGEYLTYTDLYLAYPSVAYAGSASGNTNRSFLSFLYSGPTVYPGYGVVYIDENGISDSLICRVGDDYMNPNTARWGDYADMAERPGHPGEVWVVGTYGNTFNQQRTHISEVKAPGLVAAPEPLPAPEVSMYPNPARDRVKFDFLVEDAGDYMISIRDLQGREVKQMGPYNLPQGEAGLAFNTDPLANGIYMVSIRNQERVLFSQRLAVQH